MRLLWSVALVAAAAAFASAAAMSERRPAVTTHTSAYGKVLFDGRDYVLYAFTRDHGRSACYGACARAWPPYFAPKGQLSVGAGLKRSLLGTVKRRNGRRQITYAGRPLYYYVGDTRPRQILCQDVVEYGGRWLVVRPTGSLVR
jgi:predicted lipoprotein with Yx(FWY)xxD motif